MSTFYNEEYDFYDKYGQYVFDDIDFEPNNLILFHGSDHIVEYPTYGFGNSENDAGVGFYTVQNFILAAEWASAMYGDLGVVNCYEVANNSLGDVLDLTEFNELYWLTMLVQYRSFYGFDEEKDFLLDHFYIDIDNFDVVRAYRCDDSYFDMAKSFLDNELSLDCLFNVLQAGDLGLQYVMKSPYAHDMFTFINSVDIGNDYAYSYNNKVTSANNFVDEMKTETRRLRRNNECYVIADMIDEYNDGDATLVEYY